MSAHPQERLSAFLDNELAPAQRAEVEQHLRACAACAQELSELALVDRMGRELEVDAPAGYVEGLPARLRPRLRSAAPSGRRRIVPAWVLALAALLLIGVLVPITWQQRRLDLRATVPKARAQLEVAPQQQAVPNAPPPQAASAAPEPRRRAAPADIVQPPDVSSGRSWRFAAPATPVQPSAVPEAKDELKALGYADAPRAKARLERQDSAPPATTPAAAPLRGFGLTAGGAAPAPAAAPGNDAEGKPAPKVAPPAPAPATEPPATPLTSTGTLELDKQLAEQPQPRREGAAVEAYSAVAPGVSGNAEPERKRAVGADNFAELSARSMRTAADARRQRRAWREFADLHPNDSRADEARVRAVEAAAQAYRLSGEPTDKQTLENDVNAYLGRADAQQKDRALKLVPATRR